MKIVMISDIHGNYDALSAFQETYDELWVLGDLVNYGPEPKGVVDYVKDKASLVVRGNHDHAIGFNEDPRCSAPFKAMAEAMRRFTDSVLTFGQKHFLRQLPLHIETERAGARFYLCHAIPSDPLFGYCEAGSDQWVAEAEAIDAGYIFVGHTHVPAVRSIGSRVVVNPGSLGQPKGGGAESRYALWQDGTVELKSYRYPVESAVEKIDKLPLPGSIRKELTEVLRTGNIPGAKEAHK
jgi:putative phosphoesterase